MMSSILLRTRGQIINAAKKHGYQCFLPLDMESTSVILLLYENFLAQSGHSSVIQKQITFSIRRDADDDRAVYVDWGFTRINHSGDGVCTTSHGETMFDSASAYTIEELVETLDQLVSTVDNDTVCEISKPEHMENNDD